MALNMCEMWVNGIKTAIFPKNYKKLPNNWGLSPQSLQPLGASPPDPHLWYVWVTLVFSTRLQSYIFALFNYKFEPSMFAKSWLSANRQIFDDVIACGLWFRPPQSKILAMPINWRLPEKLFWKPFFFLENTCCCVLGPWLWPRAFLSLAWRVSVLGKTVLLASVSDFYVSLASSFVSSTPPLCISASQVCSKPTTQVAWIQN